MGQRLPLHLSAQFFGKVTYRYPSPSRKPNPFEASYRQKIPSFQHTFNHYFIQNGRR